jgi:hypothetical protein
MSRFRSSPLTGLFATLAELSVDLFSFLRVAVRSRASLVAENLFLRKQLAFQALPITAAKGSARYRAVKFIARHKIGWQLLPLYS